MAKTGNIATFAMALIIAGNLIGSGLLALPICLGMAGFIPSVVSLVVVYFMMMITALIIAGKINKSADINYDIPSIFSQYLGKKLKWLAIIANLIVLYGLLIAYLAGAASIIRGTFELNFSLSSMIIVYFVLVTCIMLYGMKMISRCNGILMLILLVAFIYLTAGTAPHIKLVNYYYSKWIFLVVALPVVVNSFNFHNVVPVVCRTLNFDKKQVKRAILTGITIGLIVNTVWTLVAIGQGFCMRLFLNFHNHILTLYIV
jgi:tyrosine-specific transport protein